MADEAVFPDVQIAGLSQGQTDNKKWKRLLAGTDPVVTIYMFTKEFPIHIVEIMEMSYKAQLIKSKT